MMCTAQWILFGCSEKGEYEEKKTQMEFGSKI
jgi:hypothetical protein